MELPEFYCLEIDGFSLIEENRRGLVGVAIDMMANDRRIVSINNPDDTAFCIVKRVEKDARFLGMSGSIFQVEFEEERNWKLRFFIRNTIRVKVTPKKDRRQNEIWYVGPDRRNSSKPTPKPSTLH